MEVQKKLDGCCFLPASLQLEQVLIIVDRLFVTASAIFLPAELP